MIQDTVESPVWVRQGGEQHEKLEKLFQRRHLRKYGLEEAEIMIGKSVCSEKYGLSGKIDAYFETDQEMIPVEWKSFGKKPSKGHIFQLIAYGLTLEELKQKNFRHGFILMEEYHKIIEIQNTEEKKKELLSTLRVIRQNLEKPLIPDSSADIKKCGQCEYLNFCNDRNF